jgi:hypothetical protein
MAGRFATCRILTKVKFAQISSKSWVNLINLQRDISKNIGHILEK